MFNNIFLNWTLGLVVALMTILYSFYMWSFQYWKRRNFQNIEATFPSGSVDNLIIRKEFLGASIKRVYDVARSRGWRHCGIHIFARPNYLVADLDYLRNILTKDFQYFTDRGFYYNEKDDPVGAHLFAIGGAKWRNLRTKLTPTFTSGKMRMMFQTLVDCEEILQEVMTKLDDKGGPIDIKDVLGCFTTDIIGNCAFGLDCNSSKENDSPFRKHGKSVFNAGILRSALIGFGNNFPDAARMLRIRQLGKEPADFYMNVVKEAVEYREKNNVTRKDFLQLLIELKNNNSAEYNHDGKTLTIEEVAAQSFIFFFAGFETSSTTMAFALYELARNQKLQDKVRAEITAVLAKHDDKITYDSISELKYMSQVIDVPLITRECVRDYKVPDDDIILEKGMRIIVSILGIHHDPQLYPDPEKFDPERFSEENKRNRHQYAHIPFGEGPRICIGMRFGIMQSKVGITSVLKHYRLTVNSKTKEPLTMVPYAFIPTVDGDIWLDAERL